MTTERIKEIQSQTAHPNSVSVQQALLQVWNEVAQKYETFNKKEMKITNKQLQMLMVLLQDSQTDVRGLFSFDLETRNKLLNEIINQQDSELIDITTNTKGQTNDTSRISSGKI